MSVKKYVLNTFIILTNHFVNMFRHHKFHRFVYPCVSVPVEVETTQLDKLGMTRVSSAPVDVESYNDSFPLVSEVSLDSQIVKGTAAPVNLNGFTIDKVEPYDVNSFVEKLNPEPSK